MSTEQPIFQILKNILSFVHNPQPDDARTGGLYFDRMNQLSQQKFSCKPALGMLSAVVLLMLAGCGDGTSTPKQPAGDGVEPTGPFELRSANPPELNLLEGDENGLRIPLSLERKNGYDQGVKLEVRGRLQEDVAFVTSSFSELTLTPNKDESEAVLKLSIADAPIKAQTRNFIIVASDGVDTDTIPITVNVEPTSAPDVYLLAGQSNMIGFSGDGTRQSDAGGADEPNERIKQLNVTRNEDSKFITGSDYISESNNIVQPDIVKALDPLHIPQDPQNDNGKDLSYIGLGLSFGKRALADTTSDIILVPAAWSGSSFCANPDGPTGNWMAEPSDDPIFGNTLLYDRAVARANLALTKSKGVFRGILWHQGESDANDRCAARYAENLKKLVDGMRKNIVAVGDKSLRRPESTIPFVLGTMSRGVDERGDLSTFLDDKQTIDDAHKAFPQIIDTLEVTTVDQQGVETTNTVQQPVHAGLSLHDDLIPDLGYPCGNDSCIHFGPEALREMGIRYYDALQRALAQ